MWCVLELQPLWFINVENEIFFFVYFCHFCVGAMPLQIPQQQQQQPLAVPPPQQAHHAPAPFAKVGFICIDRSDRNDRSDMSDRRDDRSDNQRNLSLLSLLPSLDFWRLSIPALKFI